MDSLKSLGRIANLEPAAMGVVVGLAIFLPAVIVSTLLYARSEEAIREEIRGNLRRIAKAASTLVDPELHKTFTKSEQESSEEYERAIAPLRGFVNLDSSIIYVYTCVLEDGKVRFVLDPTVSGDRDNDGVDDKSHIMQLYEDPSVEMLNAFKFKASTADSEPYTDDWGTFISGYAPLLDKNGDLVAIVGVDLTADRYSARLQGIQQALVFALVVAFVISCGVGFAGGMFQKSRRKWVEEQLQSHAAMEDLASSLDLANAQLRFSNRRFEGLFNSVPVACFTFDEDGTIFEWNTECERLTGLTAPSVVQKSLFESVVGRDNHELFRSIVSRVFMRTPVQGEEWTEARGEGRFTVLLNCFPIYAPNGSVSGGIAACADITVRKGLEDKVESQMREIQHTNSELELNRQSLTHANDALTEANERLRRLALVDALTGILNRRAIFEVLEKCVSNVDRTGRDLSILMVDIDHFKSLNDAHGHIKGDGVLKSVASVLKQASRLQDEVGRYGGEEFLIVLPEGGEDEAMTVAERVRKEVQGHESDGLWVTVSVGVATYRHGFSTIEQFVDAADKALYESKRRGRNRVIHYRELKEGAA